MPLRERTRLRTRREIRSAALALFAERGYSATGVRDIAAAAGVSVATFFRHYPAKSDVVFAGQDEAVPALRTARAEQAAGPPFRQVRHALVAAQLGPRSDAAGETLVARLIGAEPELEAHATRLAAELEAVVAEHLAASGLPGVRAQLLAGATFGALRAARRLAARSPAAELPRLLEEAFNVLDPG